MKGRPPKRGQTCNQKLTEKNNKSLFSAARSGEILVESFSDERYLQSPYHQRRPAEVDRCFCPSAPEYFLGMKHLLLLKKADFLL